MAEAAIRRGTIVVIAEGEPERTCPIWKDLSASGRVEAVVDLESFALSAARIPASHPANLVEAFPRPRDLDRLLVAAAVTGFSAALALGAAALEARRHLRAEGEADRVRALNLEARLSRLGDNEREIVRLRNEAPDGPGPLPAGRHAALIRLAAAIPDTLTLSSLIIEMDGGFELEALVIGGEFDPEKTRSSLERCGFAPTKDKGWVYDAGAGKLFVRGVYGEGRP